MSLTTERRPFTDAERLAAMRLLERERPRALSIIGTSIFLLVVATFLAPLLAGGALMLLDGLGLRVNIETTLKIFVTLALVVLAWQGWVVYSRVVADSRLAADVEVDLAEGSVEVLHVDTARVFLTFLPWTDEPGYLSDLGDGRALFTKGGHVSGLIATRFPCRRFSVVKLPASGFTLEVVPEGEPFAATLLEQSFAAPRDGEVVRLPPALP